MTTNEQRQLGRAKNAILAFFERRISVPKIYIDAVWDGHPIDVLAIDRDGVGDVHVVLLLARDYYSEAVLEPGKYDQLVEEVIDRLLSIQAQYKYLAVVDISNNQNCPPFRFSERVIDKAFAQDGIGKIGLLQIDISPNIIISPNEEILVRLEIKPERFRAKIAKLADDYIQQHEADWEIRA
jgi:hypothetical protein